MKIGTDISIQTCREEGYSVIEFKVRELYPNGRKAGIDKDHPVRYTTSIPAYIKEEMGWSVGSSILSNDLFLSWNDLLEIYTSQDEKSINSFAGVGTFHTEYPTEYDILQLADILNGYCGLD